MWQAVRVAAPHSCVDRECVRSMAPGHQCSSALRWVAAATLRRARFLGEPPMHAAGQGEVQGSARAFGCAACGVQVLVCSRCDRGQRYCGRECARRARCESLRRAGRHYQSSRAGRFAHARRSLRYRQRQRAQQIVTHQCSRAPVPGFTVTMDSTQGTAAAQRPQDGEPPPEAVAAAMPGAWCCHWCRRGCAPLLRRGFLRHGRVHRAWLAHRGGMHGRPP